MIAYKKIVEFVTNVMSITGESLYKSTGLEV